MLVKVSVIIPVYKVEEYISDCIHSLLNQTLEEIEIIAVDDRGHDKSVEIIREIKASHPRGGIIKIIEMPQNSRAGMARNAGIDNSSGEYLAFVDSDDRVEPDMFEALYNKAKEEDSDICFSDAVKEYADGKTEILSHPDILPGELTHEKRARMLVEYVTAFWTVIYKRSLWIDNNIRFPKEKYEDSFIIPMVLLYAKRFSYVKKVFYHYIIRENSICTSIDDTKYQHKIDLFNKLFIELNDRGLYEEYKPELDFLYIKKAYLVPLFNYVLNSEKPKKATIRSIRNGALNIVPNYQKNKYYKQSKLIRCIDSLFRFCPTLTVKIFKLYAQKKRLLF